LLARQAAAAFGVGAGFGQAAGGEAVDQLASPIFVVIAAIVCQKLFLSQYSTKAFRSTERKQHVVTTQKNAGSIQFQPGHREDTAR
jgi:hypothetical protein